MADYKKELKAFTDSIKQKLEKNIKEQLQYVGTYSKETIYKRVKTGGGVDDDTSDSASKKGLKKLSKGYVEQRKKYPGKGDYFSPGRSNLTYTGQMLDAIDFKVSKGIVTLFIKNNRRSDGKNTNKEVAEYVRDDRPFFTLTVPEQRVLFRNIEKNVRDFIRLAFKKG